MNTRNCRRLGLIFKKKNNDKSAKKMNKTEKEIRSPAVYTGIKNNSRAENENENKRIIKIPIKVKVEHFTDKICPSLSNQLVRGK